jgi:hypothetical protein
MNTLLGIPIQILAQCHHFKSKHINNLTHNISHMYHIFNLNSQLVMYIYINTHISRCATSRTVPGSIPGGVTWDFFHGSFRQNRVPWGRLSLRKWVSGISPGVKAACAFGWQLTTLVVPEVVKIWGLNLPRTPRATLASHGIPLLLLTIVWMSIYYKLCCNI